MGLLSWSSDVFGRMLRRNASSPHLPLGQPRSRTRPKSPSPAMTGLFRNAPSLWYLHIFAMVLGTLVFASFVYSMFSHDITTAGDAAGPLLHHHRIEVGAWKTKQVKKGEKLGENKASWPGVDGDKPPIVAPPWFDDSEVIGTHACLIPRDSDHFSAGLLHTPKQQQCDMSSKPFCEVTSDSSIHVFDPTCLNRTFYSVHRSTGWDPDWLPLPEDTPLFDNGEHLFTACRPEGGDWQYNLLVQCQALPSVLKRVEAFHKNSSSTWPTVNIVMVVLGSISRVEFLREMPATVAAMKDVSASPYNLMDVAGPNSTHEDDGKIYSVFHYPSYIAIGESEEEQKRALFTASLLHKEIEVEEEDGEEEEEEENKWIWEIFRDSGYVTAYAKDSCTTSGVEQAGIAAKISSEWDHALVTPICAVQAYSTETESKCFGGAHIHHYAIEYIKKFRDSYANVPTFSVLDLGNENVDAELATLVHDIADNRTVFIVMALGGRNHGEHHDMSDAGRYDAALPPLFLGVPNEYLAAVDDAHVHAVLQDSQRQLVTPFDIHATLVNIVHHGHPDTGLVHPQAHGLLHHVPSRHRDCTSAGVPAESCPCADWLSVKSPTAAELKQMTAIANVVVDQLNALNSFTTTCAFLTIDNSVDVQFSVLRSSLWSLHNPIVGPFHIYRIKFVTKGHEEFYPSESWTAVVAEGAVVDEKGEDAKEAHRFLILKSLKPSSTKEDTGGLVSRQKYKTCADERVPLGYCICKLAKNNE